jgi:uncharacterized surface protein with fasciclin (FAS1) repeats
VRGVFRRALIALSLGVGGSAKMSSKAKHKKNKPLARPARRAAAARAKPARSGTTPTAVVRRLEAELSATRQEQQHLIEQLETSNEELTTLNTRLQEKVQEVIAANDDLANLLVSTDIATVFVDKAFRIKRFTTAASQLLLWCRPTSDGRSPRWRRTS